MTLISFIVSLFTFFHPSLDNDSTGILNKAVEKNVSSERFSVWGLDLSHHNGDINWGKIADTKPHFVFIKATEGATFIDKRYETNWSYLKKHSILRGAYHFFNHRWSGTLQAKHFISKVSLSAGDMPPIIDLEFARRMPAPKKVTKEVKKYLAIIESHYKVKPIIYCPLKFYKRYLKGKISGDYPLWICDYRAVPDTSTNWLFWQHTDRFKIPGIKKGFDRNVFRYDNSKLKSLLIK